jgi:Protein of unknown function (DUF1523)
MWVYVKWGFRIFLLLIVAGFLHYTLPQHDIVRVTNAYNRLTTVGENAIFYASPDTGTGESTETRDIRFIDAVFADGSVIVYRNEDTGWVWPPYFKYDSSNLQAEATNLKSTAAAPQWVSVTHYGWRFPFLSIYPNAVSMRAVEGPDVRIIPWVNIVLLTTLLVLVFMIRRMWLQFRERMVDPTLADVDASVDAARAKATGFFGRIAAWFRTWRK